MSSRRKNPGRACKATPQPHAVSPSGVSESSSDFETPKSRKRRRQQVQRPKEESEDSSFSAHLSDDGHNLNGDEISAEIPDEIDLPTTRSSRSKITKTSTTAEKRRKTHVKKGAGETGASDNNAEMLSSRQKEVLSRVFKAFDLNENERISRSDLLRVADNHGVILTTDEAWDMIRFWDTSGTATISRSSFTDLAIECNFITPKTQSK